MNKSSRSLGGKIVLVAVVGDLDAAHQFHDEVRPARFGRAGIEHLGDVRMIHHRQRLPLGLEARDDLLRVHAELDDLERHAAPHRLLLLGHVDDAAAAFADLLEQLVAANPVARLLRDENGGSESVVWTVRKFRRSIMRLKQRKHLLLQLRITAASLRHEALRVRRPSDELWPR